MKKSKVLYAAGCIDGKPKEYWRKVNNKIIAFLHLDYTWDNFIECMEDQPLPKAHRKLRTYKKLCVLKQCLNQSIESFLVHYDSIEHMLNPVPEDWFLFFMIITNMHEYLKNSLCL